MQNIADKLSTTGLLAAYDHIEGLNGKTPLIKYGTIHQDGYTVIIYIKFDTLNPEGSFKRRGAEFNIDEAIKDGVLKEGDTVMTASAGNHAQGVAKAARDHGLKAIVYMSSEAPQSKIERTRKLGGIVELVQGGYPEAAEEAIERSRQTGIFYVPAYEDANVILGQSTVATEVMIQLSQLRIRPDFFVSPFGGGGLANGIGYASRYFDEQNLFRYNGSGRTIYNFAVQAETFATMARSFQANHIVDYEPKGETIADGIRVPNASEQMLELSKRYIDGFFTASEAEIRAAIRRVYNSELLRGLKERPYRQLRGEHGFTARHRKGLSRMNIIEGAAATAFACVFADNRLPYEFIAEKIHPRKEIVGVVIASGNNIDRQKLSQILKEKE